MQHYPISTAEMAGGVRNATPLRATHIDGVRLDDLDGPVYTDARTGARWTYRRGGPFNAVSVRVELP